VQCERSLRALSYIFHGWAQYTGKRKFHFGKPDNRVLPIIEFEKLALFWCRLWQNLWRIDGARDERAHATRPKMDTQKLITFPPPFVIERAKHGKRPQRYDGIEKPVTLAEILCGLQDLGIRYFDIHPFVEAGTAYPNHYKTEVHPTLPPERRSQLLEGFSGAEVKCLDDIDNVVRRLGTSEIRALGTHEDLQETMRDIELEFDVIVTDLVPLAVSRIANGQPFLDVAQDILEYADEAYKKSCADRKEDYESAYGLFLNDTKDALVRAAFSRSQVEASAIFDSAQMNAVALRAEQARAVGKVLAAVAYFRDHSDERSQPRSSKAREMKHAWDEGISGFGKHNILGFPSELDGVYVGSSSQLRPAIRDRFLEVLSGFHR